MMRVTLLVCTVLFAIISTSNANWYGKRGEKEDLVGNFLRHRFEGMPLNDAEATLAAIGQLYKDWESRKAAPIVNRAARR